MSNPNRASEQKTTAEGAVAVIFDMDGVLVDSAEPHFQSWRQLAEEYGGQVTAEQFAQTFGRPNDDIIPSLFGPVDDTRLKSLAARKEEIYRALVRQRLPIVDGAAALVRDLHTSGVRLAVGSSGPLENIELILGRMGVRDCFTVVVSGDDVTRGKPDPQVFVTAIDRLGVCAARTVVIEDAPVGVDAARAAGARSVAILLYHPAEAFDCADLVAGRVADLSVEQLTALARAS